MKNKASLVLMEQLIMLLVFALAAALCLQIFVKADSISRQTALRDEAVCLAQSGAEAVKAASGDLETAAAHLGGQLQNNSIYVTCDELKLNITPEVSSVPGLGSAQVTVRAADTEEILFCITTGWQEVAP